jgi:hypothetical protein
MAEPAYPAAKTVATRVEEHFRRHIESLPPDVGEASAVAPAQAIIEGLVDVAFWASLRREEGYTPRISIAYVPPQQNDGAMVFHDRLPLTPGLLARLAPAVERPGIHLGVWAQDGELLLWGSTRTIPAYCFVLEVAGPGLLVIKHRRREQDSKFLNVVVLEGDAIKFVSEQAPLAERPSISSALLGFYRHEPEPDSVDYLVELATSMRAHGRGGALLLVPQGSDSWLESVIQPIAYRFSPTYSGLRELALGGPSNATERRWALSLRRIVDGIAGLTAVDGATVINSSYDLLAFGVKIIRRTRSPRVEQLILTEPIDGAAPKIVTPGYIGGTRHSSAAQFAHDQQDAVSLVASQDGRFTVFAWSDHDRAVVAHRAESLLL